MFASARSRRRVHYALQQRLSSKSSLELILVARATLGDAKSQVW